MIGQYSEKEVLNMSGRVSSINLFLKGKIIRKVGLTINYYRKERDGSWTNYNCRTVSGGNICLVIG